MTRDPRNRLYVHVTLCLFIVIAGRLLNECARKRYYYSVETDIALVSYRIRGELLSNERNLIGTNAYVFIRRSRISFRGVPSHRRRRRRLFNHFIFSHKRHDPVCGRGCVRDTAPARPSAEIRAGFHPDVARI